MYDLHVLDISSAIRRSTPSSTQGPAGPALQIFRCLSVPKACSRGRFPSALHFFSPLHLAFGFFRHGHKIKKKEVG